MIKQVQDRTQPSITLVPHKLTVSDTNLLVLEIPFSMQIHCTTKGEYIIRCNNGNRLYMTKRHGVYIIGRMKREQVLFITK